MAALYLSEPKKKAAAEGAKLIFEDEASFRQDATLYRTWARRGQTPLIPVTGQRKSVKIFAAVEVFSAEFVYQRDRVFSGETYLGFLEGSVAARYRRRGPRVIYIQDNASYHKEKRVWEWFTDNRKWLEVHQLPPYSPEFNAAEPLWHHTRVNATHNRSFKNEEEIIASLQTTFSKIQREPKQIMGYLRPFQ